MDSLVEIGSCEECGLSGPKEEFYSNSKRFCTAACSHSFSAKHRFNKNQSAPKGGGAANPQTKNKPSDSKSKAKRFILPSESQRHQCISMGFDWGRYLSTKKATSASVDLFNHAPMAAHWGDIGVGMKIEVLNLDCCLNTEVYWIASVIDIAGYKAKLRYEGFGEDGSCDFWCNLCTLDVNAVGWCATIGKPLVPPQTIQHKYTNWKGFLVKKLTGAKTLPSDFQTRITDSVISPFLTNFRLEVVDKTRISRMRIGIVNEVVGGRLRLKYEDSDYENDDFWCHSQSSLIHPVGWCERVGHKILVSTKDYKVKKGFKNARQELFSAVKSVKSCGFKVGMKLEAIDPLNLSAICAGTVKKVLKNGYLMIGIDGSEAADGSDWFCYHCTAPSIFPVGFCKQNNISLSVPPPFKDNFSWESYLHETDSQPASVELFDCQLPDHGFKAGMKLEAVDLMEPRLICVATVTKVVGRLLHVHFDGWETQYDQWVDCESPDIYPVGWCELVGYDLQPPPNMIVPVDQNTSLKKKKTKGQSFMMKKKRKKSSKKQLETSTALKVEGADASTGKQQPESKYDEISQDNNSQSETNAIAGSTSDAMTKPESMESESGGNDIPAGNTLKAPTTDTANGKISDTINNEAVPPEKPKSVELTANAKASPALPDNEQNTNNHPDDNKDNCDSTMQQEESQAKQPVSQSDVTEGYCDGNDATDTSGHDNASRDVDDTIPPSVQS